MEFGTYVRVLRRQKNISLEKLCRGICSVAQMKRIESRERRAGKLLQDRLLQRLDVHENVFGNILEPDEYELWEHRQGIRSAIAHGEWEKAECRLENYECAGSEKSSLERQFCMAMRGLLLRHEGSEERAARVFGEALALTVPDVGVRPLEELCLAPQEISLYLESIPGMDMRESAGGGQAACPGLSWERMAERYKELVIYLERNQKDPLIMAEIYPKAVICLCRHCRRPGEKDMVREGQSPQPRNRDGENGGKALPEKPELLAMCQRAIGLLQDTGRTCYLRELLEEALPLLQGELQEAERLGRVQEAGGLKEFREQAETLRGIPEGFSGRNGIPGEAGDICYLYAESEARCIGDVVRARRRLLGMTQKQLCDKICSIRTLSRMEQGQSVTQSGISRKLLDRLGLAEESGCAEPCEAELEKGRKSGRM